MATYFFKVVDTETNEVLLDKALIQDVCYLIGIKGEKYVSYYARQCLNGYVFQRKYRVFVLGEKKAPKRTEEEKNAICERYANGETLDALADKYHISIATLKTIISENGIHLRSRAEASALGQRLKKKNGREKSLYQNAVIHDFPKVAALRKAGWSVKKIAVEFNTDEAEVNRCLEALKMK